MSDLQRFLNSTLYPLVIVSSLPAKDRETVLSFLLQLNAPVYLEAISGIREEPRLEKLRITCIEDTFKRAASAAYPVDGILRIGGVPTAKVWRDLEELQGRVSVCSISRQSFAGLSWGEILPFEMLREEPSKHSYAARAEAWLEADRALCDDLIDLIKAEPNAEPALVHQLSQAVPPEALLYLGNSLPIREWDFAATYTHKHVDVYASRGVNGIDGQVSTFLGLAQKGIPNWGLFGDLTLFYDLVAPWVLPQLSDIHLQIVVINNGGGKIFKGMFRETTFQNSHNYQFEHFAKLWGIDYSCADHLKDWKIGSEKHLLELQPCPNATARFWKTYREELLKQERELCR